MKDVKLTDFSEEQLQKLLVAVLAEQAMKTMFGKEDEDLQLWRVQILNAISTVKMREIHQSN